MPILSSQNATNNSIETRAALCKFYLKINSFKFYTKESDSKYLGLLPSIFVYTFHIRILKLHK